MAAVGQGARPKKANRARHSNMFSVKLFSRSGALLVSLPHSVDPCRLRTGPDQLDHDCRNAHLSCRVPPHLCALARCCARVLCAQQPEKEALRNGVRINHFLVTVRAKHNFNGRDPEDLSFRKGEMLNVVEKHEPQWWKAQSQDTLQVGVIPSNYVDQYALGPIEIAKKEAAEAAKKRAEYESQASAKVRTRSTEPLLSIACIYTVTPWLAG